MIIVYLQQLFFYLQKLTTCQKNTSVALSWLQRARSEIRVPGSVAGVLAQLGCHLSELNITQTVITGR